MTESQWIQLDVPVTTLRNWTLFTSVNTISTMKIPTVFIRLQAEQFFHKTLPKSRKFELEKGPRLIAECFSKQNFSETANSWET